MSRTGSIDVVIRQAQIELNRAKELKSEKHHNHWLPDLFTSKNNQ